jgi:hypothetical protein
MPVDVTDYSGRKAVYVSTAGDDSNPGTLASPFRTIEKGLEAAESGGILYVAEGTYKTQMLEIDKPLVLATSGKVTLVPKNPSSTDMSDATGILISGQLDGVVVDGFNIQNFSRAGIIYGDSKTQKNIILKNIMISGSQEAIVNTYPQHIAYLVNGLLLKNITISGSGFIGIQCGDEYNPCARNVMVDNVRVSGSLPFGDNTAADALAMVQSENILVRDSLFEYAAGDGLDFKASNVSVVNVTVRYIARNGVKFWRDGELLGSSVHDTGADAAIVFDCEVGGSSYKIIDSLVYSHLSRASESERYSYALTACYDNPNNKAYFSIANSTFNDMPGPLWVSRSTDLSLDNVTFNDFRDDFFLALQDGKDYSSADELNKESFAQGIVYSEG